MAVSEHVGTGNNATTDRRRGVSPSRWSKAFRYVALLVGLGALVWVLSQISTGVEGTPRANPDPVQYPYGSPPGRPWPPLFGITNWPLLIELAFYIGMVGIMTPLLWISWKNRRLHELVVVYLCTTSILIFDPIANWSTFTIYDPRLTHFPHDWWWAAWSPTLEPVVVVPGYGAWLVGIALISSWFNRRFVLPRMKPSGWFARHPLTLMFIVGFVLGALWDIAIELTMMRGMFYYYAQHWGPAIHWDFVTLPLTEIHIMAVAAGFTTAMVYRDDRGEMVFMQVVRKLRFLPNKPVLATFIIGCGLMWSMYAVCNLGWFALRAFHLTNTVYDEPWRYPETKVYDPQGVLREQGHPGPFYDDSDLGVGLKGYEPKEPLP
jgi:hypothetical protein